MMSDSPSHAAYDQLKKLVTNLLQLCESMMDRIGTLEYVELMIFSCHVEFLTWLRQRITTYEQKISDLMHENESAKRQNVTIKRRREERLKERSRRKRKALWLEAYYRRQKYGVRDLNELLGTDFHEYDIDMAWAQLRSKVEHKQLGFPDRKVYVWYREEEETWKRAQIGGESYRFEAGDTDEEYGFQELNEELPNDIDEYLEARYELKRWFIMRNTTAEINDEDGGCESVSGA
jgi:hypothetical protein